MNIPPKATTLTKARVLPLFSTRDIVKIGLLSAVSFALMLLQFPLAFLFPSFLKMDLSDVPALLGAFAMGPVAGVIIELIKNILKFIMGSETGGVGEISNFIVGSAFVVPAAVIYQRMKNKKGALFGMLIGLVMMTAVACLSNYYLIIPLYTRIFPLEAIIGMAAAANRAIVDMRTYILFAVIPFNVLKALVISAATLLIYKKLSPLLHR